MQNVVTEGTVLRRSNSGEADKIMTFYTKDLGKITAVARGVRKHASKQASHLEPGNVIRLELVSGKNMYTITGAKVLKAYRFEQLPRLRALFMWLELIDKLTEAGESNMFLYGLVTKGLAVLTQDSDPEITQILLELELYSTTGYKLEVNHCIVGREVLIEQGNSVSISQGGVVCPNHSNDTCLPISVHALKILRIIGRGEADQLRQLTIPPTLGKEIGLLARAQRHQVLGRDLKSESIMVGV